MRPQQRLSPGVGREASPRRDPSRCYAVRQPRRQAGPVSGRNDRQAALDRRTLTNCGRLMWATTSDFSTRREANRFFAVSRPARRAQETVVRTTSRQRPHQTTIADPKQPLLPNPTTPPYFSKIAGTISNFTYPHKNVKNPTPLAAGDPSYTPIPIQPSRRPVHEDAKQIFAVDAGLLPVVE